MDAFSETAGLVGVCVLAIAMLLNVGLSLYTDRLETDEAPHFVVTLRRGTLVAGAAVVAAIVALSVVAIAR